MVTDPSLNVNKFDNTLFSFLNAYPCCRPQIDAFYHQAWTNSNMIPHRHERFEIMYVTSGTMQVPIYDDKKGEKTPEIITLKRGDAIFIDPSTIHGFSNPERNKPVNVLNIEFRFFNDASCSGLINTKELVKNSPSMKIWEENYKPYIFFHDESGNLQQILIMLIERATQLPSLATCRDDSQVNLLFWSMLLMFSDYTVKCFENRPHSSYVQLMEAYLLKNYSGQVSIEDMAENFHLNPSYMQRIFKKGTGISIISYVNNMRMKKAAQLMMSGMPLIEIAINCGINSRQHFWKLFQKHYGCSPNEYRQNCYSDPKIYISYGFSNTEVDEAVISENYE